jgi:hypothetical protein
MAAKDRKERKKKKAFLKTNLFAISALFCGHFFVF